MMHSIVETDILLRQLQEQPQPPTMIYHQHGTCILEGIQNGEQFEPRRIISTNLKDYLPPRQK